MVNKLGIIYNEGFNRNAMLAMIDTYVEDTNIRIPACTPEKELTDAFTASFNRIAPKGYKIDLDKEGIFPPWATDYTDSEIGLEEADTPEENRHWKPTDSELEELIWEAIDRIF
jgi:hypothetical protein